jgi:hypothetical protein
VIWLLAGIGLLVLLWIAARAFVATDPASLARGLRWAGIGIGAGIVIVLAVRGLIVPAVTLAGSLALALLRLKPLWDMLRRGGIGPAPGRRSAVETEWLRSELDHDSGEMSGTVRRGAFQGRRLAELGRDELVALWRECRAEDEASAALVEAYLDRVYPAWREEGRQEEGRRDEAGAGAPSASGPMSEREAWQVLDLAPGASAAEIKAAHRRLMMKLHPDTGGSTWLASRINEAKDLLLKKAKA